MTNGLARLAVPVLESLDAASCAVGQRDEWAGAKWTLLTARCLIPNDDLNLPRSEDVPLLALAMCGVQPELIVLSAGP